MQIVYASERPSDLGDRIFKNPRHFLAADGQATKVFVVGSWPNVVAAYDTAKIPVVQLQPGQSIADGIAAAKEPAASKAKPAPSTEPTKP